MIPKNTDFWVALFGFLGTCVGSIRYLLRVGFVYRQRNNTQKATLDMTVEKFKSTEAGKLVLSLKEAVDKIQPLVLEHAKRLESFASSVIEVKQVEMNMVALLKDTRLEYSNLKAKLENVQAGGKEILNKMKTIETEVIEMKSGNIFVRTKK